MHVFLESFTFSSQVSSSASGKVNTPQYDKLERVGGEGEGGGREFYKRQNEKLPTIVFREGLSIQCSTHENKFQVWTFFKNIFQHNHQEIRKQISFMDLI